MWLSLTISVYYGTVTSVPVAVVHKSSEKFTFPAKKRYVEEIIAYILKKVNSELLNIFKYKHIFRYFPPRLLDFFWC